jgi:hypothetical protein
MLRVTRFLVPTVTLILSIALLAPPAAANTQAKSVNHVNARYTESSICPFDLRVYLHGTYKSVDYYDNTGFLYKTIDTPGGGGPFAVSYSAKGTTLTQRNDAFSTVVTYNRDGTWTYTERGAVNKFVAPGVGVVLLDAGVATWSEPDETLLFMGGPHQAANGDFDAFCAAFG